MAVVKTAELKKKSPAKKCIAIRAVSLLALLLVGTAMGAEPMGTVTDLGGALLVKRTNGSIKVLAGNSAVEQGDILVTLKETYAQVRLLDHSSMTLGPDTELTVVVPPNPGMQFAPPPTFSSSTPSRSVTGAGKSNTVDCEVR